MQRRVITLRGLEGRSANEVCDLLGLSEVNQRVLLHRARSKVRTALDEPLAPEGAIV
jgi:RNA polymerase sigma-70 factor (ECF subfamily)